MNWRQKDENRHVVGEPSSRRHKRFAFLFFSNGNILPYFPLVWVGINGEYAFEKLHGCCYRVEMRWNTFTALFVNKSKVKGWSVGLFDTTILAPAHPACFYILCHEAADVEKVRLPHWISARWPSYTSSCFSSSCFSLNNPSVSYSKGVSNVQIYVHPFTSCLIRPFS